jgi:hypothetical protein
MRPDDVRPAKFNSFKVLYNDGKFSIAWGNGEDDTETRLAMRWNGDDTDPDNHGYPVRGKYPVWFDFPDRLAPLLIQALSSTKEDSLNKYLNMEAIKEAQNEAATADGGTAPQSRA